MPANLNAYRDAMRMAVCCGAYEIKMKPEDFDKFVKNIEDIAEGAGFKRSEAYVDRSPIHIVRDGCKYIRGEV